MSRKFLMTLFVLALPILLIVGMKVSGVIKVKTPAVKIQPPAAVELSTVPNVSIKRRDRVHSRGNSTSSSGTSYEMSVFGTELKFAAQNLARGASMPLIGVDNLPEGVYDIKVKSPTGGQAGAARLFAQGLASAFPELEVKVDKLPATVYRLRCPDLSKMGSEFTVQSGGKSTGYSMSGGSTRNSMTINGPMTFIISQLSNNLDGRKIIDETALTDFYTLKVEWNRQIPEALEHELRVMGFEVVPDTEVMDVFSITPRPATPAEHNHEEAPAADPTEAEEADKEAAPQPPSK